MSAVVQIENIDIVFGDNTKKTLALMDNGGTRDKILAETGDVVGVHDANLQVNEGEICVLMGLSGSGKSTLLRAVNGLNQITRGKCLVRDGERMVDMGDCDEATLRHMRTHRVSMVFQSFALMPWLTVLENVTFGLEMQGMGKKERIEKATEQLKMVGLDRWADKKPDELSGGMRQRVGLARAFSMDTDVLLMDEPFSALDPLIRSQLQDELIELQRRLKKTIIFVSHDLDEALKIGSKIVIMESAKIIQEDVPEQIVLNPATEYVEKFVAHTNPLNVLRGNSLMTPISELESRDGMLIAEEGVAIKLNGNKLEQAFVNGSEVSILKWDTDLSIESLPKNVVLQVPLEISMREAVEIRYHSNHLMVLEKDGECYGVLGDHHLYHALLGKHFGKQGEVAA
ncbi:choline ABC transporter ATP-binding protein [Marinomonas mediterranea]|jgi:choline ABC transporter, ATP-binding protein|uniref:Choline ABC transporter, ATP-binding protein n=1 Tax=Marinomonas mediterranea (strain ATCC 700492 / JCM 21426 / NBRC 103028 / MMB-1) TaxID=717774 RepID=F2K485_MARM1|nr:choline ABC transporter ATP-binding protein [Marinomonas mediterranea]ADZ92526.1 choline ABC transporter, ATP-binding protein [Marinomonas mediterranea MMB-1]WCN18571.1 choline ABC transporter ATP-binding protein [Marinomonas mediterranea MMB-1]